MVEVSRDGRRVYLTNSLYARWDAQFYPEGIDGWLVKLDAGEDGSLSVDPDLFVEFDGRAAAPGAPRRRRRVARTRYCFPNGLAVEPLAAAHPGVLGAYHGLNPAMGWLFAVALGMQEGDRRAVLRALPPIAIGHELALVAGRRRRARAGGRDRRPVGAAHRRRRWR